MDEQELRSAMYAAVREAPPPMHELPVLDAARLARRRWRASVLGAASAAAVVAAIVAGMVAVAPGESGPPAVRVAEDGASPTPTGPATPKTLGGSTETAWPSGQTDRTAYDGPHFDQAVTVLERLVAALPAGLTALDGDATRYHQAQFEDWADDGTEIWEYAASVAVGRGGGAGDVRVAILTAPRLAGDECAQIPDPGGTRRELPVAGGTACVLVTRDGPVVAVHLRPDGTMVRVEQATESPASGQPPLTEPALTADELAALAAADTFGLH